MSIDPAYRIVSANKALAVAAHRSPRDIVGHACHFVLYGLDRPCPESGRLCPLNSPERQVEIIERRKPQSEGGIAGDRFMSVRAIPIIGPDKQTAEFIIVRRDVTIQRKAEIQIREHNKRLEMEVRARTKDLSLANLELTKQRDELGKANEELLRLQQLKDDLTDMVIHDLKGPLSEIVANLELLKSQNLSEMQTEFLDAAMMGTDEFWRMITNLLDISRMEEDRLILEIASFDPRHTIDGVRTRLGPLARLSGVTLTSEVADDLTEIRADERLLERILVNLMTNAVDHTPEKGRVALTARRESGWFQFEVRDNGHGIPLEMQGKIFEKFSQGKDGRPKTSSGLGLTFCKMAVEAHGGRIWVESVPGRGSRFVFTLPLEPRGLQEGRAI